MRWWPCSGPTARARRPPCGCSTASSGPTPASRVLGLDPATDGDAVRRRTGVLTEAAGLDDRLTLLENVVIPARIRGMSRLDAEREALRMLERFDMAGRAGDKAQGLSTGQRKRVALARPAARARCALPRRADLRARPRGDARRREPDRHARPRARPHRPALHPLPRRGRSPVPAHGRPATGSPPGLRPARGPRGAALVRAQRRPRPRRTGRRPHARRPARRARSHQRRRLPTARWSASRVAPPCPGSWPTS